MIQLSVSGISGIFVLFGDSLCWKKKVNLNSVSIVFYFKFSYSAKQSKHDSLVYSFCWGVNHDSTA